MTTIIIAFLTFFLGILAQRYLTRYRERIAGLNKELNQIRELCRQACIDAQNGEPCMYIRNPTELGFSYEADNSLHKKVQLPLVKDKKLQEYLQKFLRGVDEYRNIFTSGEGACFIAGCRTMNGNVDYQFYGSGHGEILNLTAEDRERRLRECSELLVRIYGDIDRRILKIMN
jgi:hypothetical protein